MILNYSENHIFIEPSKIHKLWFALHFLIIPVYMLNYFGSISLVFQGGNWNHWMTLKLKTR